MQPITVYSHATGPNPWKVVILLEELGLPYHLKQLEFPELKQPAYENININGRVPAIEDPNTGITLWESGAILVYLIEKYDTERKFSYASEPEKYLVNQWLFFQMSGQGPYMGQGAWFTHFHPEKLESARLRYVNETKRIIGVLNRALEGREYLVGDKYTIADLAFIPWDRMLEFVVGSDGVPNLEKDYPNYHRWRQALFSRPAVKRTFEIKDEAMKAKAPKAS